VFEVQEFVAFARVGAAAAAYGKLKADLPVLAFQWETWNHDKVVEANACVDVYAKENASGLVGLIGATVTVTHGLVTTVVLGSLLLVRMPFIVAAAQVKLLGQVVELGALYFSVLHHLCCWAGLHPHGGGWHMDVWMEGGALSFAMALLMSLHNC
jgi:hypothetical protein